jgi:predicted  nucleic acid-binding Zn-ribbon protein
MSEVAAQRESERSEALEAELEAMFQEMDRLEIRIGQNQEEIQKLKAETRATLARIEAAL